MPNKNNIWYRSFNNPKLEEEKWLDPSDALFDKISDQVFEKKKKRRGFVYWFVGLGSFMVLLGLVYIINPFNTNDTSLGSEAVDMTPANTEEETTPSTIVNKGNEESKSLVIEDGKAIRKKEEDLKFRNPSKEKLSRVSGQIDNLSDVNVSSISASQAMAQANVTVSSQQLQANNYRKFEAVNTGFHSSSKQQSSPVKKTNILSNKAIDFLKPLALLDLADLDFQRKFYFISLNTFIPKEDFQTLDKKNTIGLTFGLSQWNFMLNSVYQNALDPADFTFDNGIKGWNIGLSYGYALKERVSIYSSLQLERINFNSGHNSSVDYDPNAESANEMSNNLDLTMASPLGFLESNLVINRGAGTSQNEQDLKLDLHNTHRITNLSLTTGLKYKLLESSFVDVSVLTGIGANYFSSISNELTSFEIDNIGYMSGNTQINKDQESVNKLTPLVEVGLILNKELSRNLSTGFSIRHRKTLMPIYNEGDFSTNLSTYDVRWMISKSF